MIYTRYFSGTKLKVGAKCFTDENFELLWAKLNDKSSHIKQFAA